MAGRRRLLVLLVILIVGGYLWSVEPWADPRPALRVENGGDTAYEVRAYAVEDRRTAMLTNLAVTTSDGERRLASVSQLIWPRNYRNLTLADDGIQTTRIVVEPGENVTTRVRGWEPGDVTVYISQELGRNVTHVDTHVETCPQRGQQQILTFDDTGPARKGGLCA